MTLDREEKYLRALPLNSPVTVKNDDKPENIWKHVRHLMGCTGRKKRDSDMFMVVVFDLTISVGEQIHASTTTVEIPYEILTCETIRVMEKIAPDDIYTKAK